MMLLVVVNVLARGVYHAIVGVYTVTGLMGAMLVSLVFAYTMLKKRHVAVTVMTSRLPQRAEAARACFAYLVSTAIFLMMGASRAACDLPPVIDTPLTVIPQDMN